MSYKFHALCPCKFYTAKPKRRCDSAELPHDVFVQLKWMMKQHHDDTDCLGKDYPLCDEDIWCYKDDEGVPWTHAATGGTSKNTVAVQKVATVTNRSRSPPPSRRGAIGEPSMVHVKKGSQSTSPGIVEQVKTWTLTDPPLHEVALVNAICAACLRNRLNPLQW